MNISENFKLALNERKEFNFPLVTYAESKRKLAGIMAIGSVIALFLSVLLLLSSCTSLDRTNPVDPGGSIDPADWAPQNFSAQTVNTDQIKLSWDYDSDVDIDGFIIYRRHYSVSLSVDEGWTELSAQTGNIYTFTDQNASVNITYEYKIISYIEETHSEKKTLRHTAGFTINAPSNLQITKLSDTSLQLTWTDNSDNEEGFEIERASTGSATFVTLATKGANTTNHTDAGLTIDETYTYRVKATHSYGDLDWSNEASQTMSSGPDDNFVEIAGGAFQMGSTSYSDEQPIHFVTVSAFWMSPYEVSQSEVLALLGDQGWSDSYGKGDNHPAYYVTWYEAVEYCNVLSVQAELNPAYTINGTDVTCDFTKNGYRLPT
ncbi:MAG: SUMF1/EgtB/PvdO family nonheme iron enzyme, partial [Candidatus Marinimicrobia bacterium]|nr:SUMF1/EgtB/PvdO family nonheme iron enzyme [Candidatus Neomarinimicrobiota bacterium]